VIFDADHGHVGQPDKQRAHARSVGLHRGSGGWTGVGTSDSGAPAPHPRTPRSASYPTRRSEAPDISRLGQGIAEHGPAYAYLAAHLDRAEWYQLDRFDDYYIGHWSSLAEYAEQFLEDLGFDLDEIGPELLQPYISVDLDAFARDLADDYLTAEDPDGGVYVFQRE
jgi:hypothetical protein